MVRAPGSKRAPFALYEDASARDEAARERRDALPRESKCRTRTLETATLPGAPLRSALKGELTNVGKSGGAHVSQRWELRQRIGAGIGGAMHGSLDREVSAELVGRTDRLRREYAKNAS
jgi:hypothetical protein